MGSSLSICSQSNGKHIWIDNTHHIFECFSALLTSIPSPDHTSFSAARRGPDRDGAAPEWSGWDQSFALRPIRLYLGPYSFLFNFSLLLLLLLFRRFFCFCAYFCCCWWWCCCFVFFKAQPWPRQCHRQCWVLGLRLLFRLLNGCWPNGTVVPGSQGRQIWPSLGLSPQQNGERHGVVHQSLRFLH